MPLSVHPVAEMLQNAALLFISPRARNVPLPDLYLVNAAQILTRPVVGLTEIVLACAMIGILILKPGGIIETSEIGELAWWKNAFGKKSE